MAIIGAIMSQTSYSAVLSMEIDSSLLASAFNFLLVNALNRHDQGKVDQFLLLHADICPIDTATWLDQLYAAKVAAKAEVISAVAPIKDARGVSSVALETSNIYAPRRLTMTEIDAFPETFTDPNLLINTGMLLMDLHNDWADKLCFTIGDKMLRTPDGRRAVGVTPEDWDISRQLRSHGVTLWATKAVKLSHVGRFNYPNFGKWGINATDPGDNVPTGDKKAE